MFASYVKQLFLFIFVGLLVTSCDSDDDNTGWSDCPSGSYDCAGVCDGTAVLEDNGECHDHGEEHCDEIDDEMECSASDHCEWHADEGACEDHDDHDDHDHGDHDDDSAHTDADGLVLEDSDGNVWYREFEGAIENNLQSLEVGDVLDLSVHFLDHDGDEIEHVHSDDEEDGLNIVITDGAIISVVVEEHSEVHCDDISNEMDCDASEHCEWHADDNACEDEAHDEDGDHDEHADEDHDELAIELTAVSAGSTTFQIQLMHGDHADYTTSPIAVTVSLPTAMSCNSVCFKNCCSSQLYASK